jgi:hypothetical protein
VPLPATDGGRWLPGEVTELAGVNRVCTVRFSAKTPIATTAITPATANAGLNQAPAGPIRPAVLPAGVRPRWACCPRPRRPR